MTWLCEGHGQPPEGEAAQGASLSHHRGVTAAPCPRGRTWGPPHPEAPPLAPAPHSCLQPPGLTSFRGGCAEDPCPRQPVDPKQAFPLVALRGLGQDLAQLGVEWEACHRSRDGAAGTRGFSRLSPNSLLGPSDSGEDKPRPAPRAPAPEMMFSHLAGLGLVWEAGLVAFGLGLTSHPCQAQPLCWPLGLGSCSPNRRPVSGGGPSPCWAAHVALLFGLQAPVLLGRPVPALPCHQPALPAVLRDTAAMGLGLCPH